MLLFFVLFPGFSVPPLAEYAAFFIFVKRRDEKTIQSNSFTGSDDGEPGSPSGNSDVVFYREYLIDRFIVF